MMENLFDKLYARDSKGRINTWEIYLGNIGEHSIINIKEGLINGRLTDSKRTVKSGKNIGKMNETTSYEQAISQAKSRWNKKKKEGYKSLSDLEITNEACLEVALSMVRTDAENHCKPMKAQPYFKDNGEVRIKFPCFGQPKLNGFRVMASWEEIEEGEGMFKTKVEKVVFRSKEGLKYTILEHISDELTKDLFIISEPFVGNLVLDGEMYIHKEILSEISSAVRKRNFKTPLLQFNIFDFAIENMNQKNRITLMEGLKTHFRNKKVKNSKIIETTIISSNEEAQAFTDLCIKEGYEGAIFRDINALYRFGSRPTTMVKLKRSQDKEFQIINIVGGENTPNSGVFVCIAENGKEFKVTPEGTKEKKEEYLSNKENYIGKQLTVRFFERTKDNLPFHAVGVVRDYE